MEGKLNHTFDEMTMPEELSERIQRSMERKLRRKRGGRYVGRATTGGKGRWSGPLAACLALALLLGGGAWMLRGTMAPQESPAGETAAPTQALAQYNSGNFSLFYPQEWTVNEGENGKTVTFSCPQLGRAALLVIEQMDAYTLQAQTDGKGFVIPSDRVFDRLVICSKDMVLLNGLEAGKVVFTYGEAQNRVVQYSLLFGSWGYQITCNLPAVNTDVYLRQLEAAAESFQMVQEEDRDAIYQDGGVRIVLPSGWSVKEQRGEDGRTLTFRDPEEKASLTIRQGEGWIVENLLDAEGLRIPGEEDWKYESLRRERKVLAGSPAAYTERISADPPQLEEEYCLVVDGVGFFVNLVCPNTTQEIAALYPALDSMVQSLVLLPREDSGFTPPTPAQLEEMEMLCRILPDFEGDTSVDGIFWQELLSGLCTEDTITVYSDEAQMYPVTPAGRGEFANGQWDNPEGTMVKLSREQVESYVNEILGLELPQFPESDPDLGPGQWAVYYQDGFFYIGVGERDGLTYLYSNSGTISSAYDRYTVVDYLVLDGEESLGKVTLVIRPADRENGFIVCSKQTEWTYWAQVYCPDEQATCLNPVLMCLPEISGPNLVEALKDVGVLKETVLLNSMEQRGEDLLLDFNGALCDQVNATGLTGENAIVQSIVQTFLGAYGEATAVVITVEGQSWESGHRIYDRPIVPEPI